MYLTKHFELSEFIASSVALRQDINNTPPASVIENLRRVALVLELVRNEFGQPLRISSGYRSPELNRAIGGSRSSAHVAGLAADFTVDNVPVREVCEWIRDNITGFDQVIYEFGKWCHLGLAPPEVSSRQQVLTAGKRCGKTIYLPGIVEVTA